MQGKVISPRSEWSNQAIISAEDLSSAQLAKSREALRTSWKMRCWHYFQIRESLCLHNLDDMLIFRAVEHIGFWSQTACVQVSFFYLLAACSCMRHTSVPRFPHLYSKDNNCACFIELIRRLSELSIQRAWKSAI